MKKIDELGISPWPWKRCATSAHDSTGECVFNCCTWNENSVKDARLIAAAPELYKAMHEVCRFCSEGGYGIDLGGDCKNCVVGIALEKASGESEEK